MMKRRDTRPPAERIPYLTHSFNLFLVRTLYAALTILSGYAVAVLWGREAQGQYSLFLAATLIGGLMLGMGIPTATLYFVARGDARATVARETAWALGLFWLVFGGAVVWLLHVWRPEWLAPVIETVLGSPNFWLLTLLLVASAASVTWETQLSVRLASGQMTRYMQLLVVRSVLAFFLVTVVLVGLPAPTEGFSFVRIWPAVGWTAALLATVLFASVEGRVGHPVPYRQVFRYVGRCLPYGSATATASLNVLLLARLDHFMIYFFTEDMALVAVYWLATTASEVPRLFSGTVASLLVPQTASDHKSGRRLETPVVVRCVALVVIFILPILGGLLWLGIQLLVWFERDYHAAWPVFWVLYLGTFCLALDDIFSSHLLGKKRPHWNTWVSSGMVVGNVLLNLWLIPRYGIMGAAWATTAAYAVGMLITAGLTLWEGRISPWQLLPRPSDVGAMFSIFATPRETPSRTSHTPGDGD